jgi:hypothetical protein
MGWRIKHESSVAATAPNSDGYNRKTIQRLELFAGRHLNSVDEIIEALEDYRHLLPEKQRERLLLWLEEVESMSPKEKLLVPPTNLGGAVFRVLDLPDGSGRLEYWDTKCKSWVADVPFEPDLAELSKAPPVTRPLAERLGIPEGEF